MEQDIIITRLDIIVFCVQLAITYLGIWIAYEVGRHDEREKTNELKQRRQVRRARRMRN